MKKYIEFMLSGAICLVGMFLGLYFIGYSVVAALDNFILGHYLMAIGHLAMVGAGVGAYICFMESNK